MASIKNCYKYTKFPQIRAKINKKQRELAVEVVVDLVAVIGGEGGGDGA
jgi:hypothetical protein